MTHQLEWQGNFLVRGTKVETGEACKVWFGLYRCLECGTYSTGKVAPDKPRYETPEECSKVERAEIKEPPPAAAWCSKCNEPGLVMQAGCLTCTACGWSKCS